MDSLLYIGAGDGDDDDDEEEGESQEEEELAEPAKPAQAAKPALDYEALQRAGYSNRTSDLSETSTYKRLESEAAAARDGEAARLLEAEKAEAERAAAAEKERGKILDRKEIDKKVGYEKRYDRTHEDFRTKEKRKRSQGQQSAGGNWVEEEKRRLRHGMTGNYDS